MKHQYNPTTEALKKARKQFAKARHNGDDKQAGQIKRNIEQIEREQRKQNQAGQN